MLLGELGKGDDEEGMVKKRKKKGKANVPTSVENLNRVFVIEKQGENREEANCFLVDERHVNPTRRTNRFLLG